VRIRRLDLPKSKANFSSYRVLGDFSLGGICTIISEINVFAVEAGA
jgi:hypothetical protein